MNKKCDLKSLKRGDVIALHGVPPYQVVSSFLKRTVFRCGRNGMGRINYKYKELISLDDATRGYRHLHDDDRWVWIRHMSVEELLTSSSSDVRIIGKRLLRLTKRK